MRKEDRKHILLTERKSLKFKNLTQMESRVLRFLPQPRKKSWISRVRREKTASQDSMTFTKRKGTETETAGTAVEMEEKEETHVNRTKIEEHRKVENVVTEETETEITVKTEDQGITGIHVITKKGQTGTETAGKIRSSPITPHKMLKAHRILHLKRLSSAILFAIALLAVSCSEPVKRYSFKDFEQTDGWSKDIAAELTLDIQEGLNGGQLYICAQIVINENLNDISTIPVSIEFISPDGKRYSDETDLPLNVVQKDGIVQSNGGLLQIQWPYMKLSDTYISGRWRIIIRHRGEHPVYKYVWGLGASYDTQ